MNVKKAGFIYSFNNESSHSKAIIVYSSDVSSVKLVNHLGTPSD